MQAERHSKSNVSGTAAPERWAAARALAVLIGCSGCLDRPIGAVEPVTTNVFVARTEQTSVDQIDLLFMIDNSASMSDKQTILRLAVPDLVERLVNPVCIDADGTRGAAPPPGQACPRGQEREFNPVKDIHIGVVSSSLGDAGANDYCGTTARSAVDGLDRAHLMGSLPRGADTGATAEGFLEWRAGVTDEDQFSASFQRMVERVGQDGCGWEASLESWYRFLVDPAPYAELVRVPCPGSSSDDARCVQPATDAEGRIIVDRELLAQRAAFLRPSSLVAIIMLSDENDCSIRVGGTNWLVADTNQRMFRAASVCEEDPNDPCCYICATEPPAGCAADPVCAVEPEPRAGAGRLARQDDGENLRCFDQKRRFGYDFLYPTARYVNALTQLELCLSNPDLSLAGCPAEYTLANPLFAAGRDRSSVFLGGIIGVPWQAIASPLDAGGGPLSDPDTTLRFKTAVELEKDDTWAEILGSAGTAPRNPVMIESPFPRPGVAQGNPENGREYRTEANIQSVPGGVPMDLEYACISPLPAPRDCSLLDPRADQCDSFEGELDRPLCERVPGVDAPGTTQYWAKAYPGTRQLQVLRDYGENSIVASICARNVDTARSEQPDFGYRPAVDAIVERLKEKLGDRCLPRALAPAEDGTVPCTLVEAEPQPDAACECDPTSARREPDERTSAVIRATLASSRDQPCGPSDPRCERACLCEVLQVQQVPGQDAEQSLRACQQEPGEVNGIEGWCYVADTDTQSIGNPAIVAQCPATERRVLRFVGRGLSPNTTTLISCQGASLSSQHAD